MGNSGHFRKVVRVGSSEAALPQRPGGYGKSAKRMCEWRIFQNKELVGRSWCKRAVWLEQTGKGQSSRTSWAPRSGGTTYTVEAGSRHQDFLLWRLCHFTSAASYRKCPGLPESKGSLPGVPTQNKDPQFYILIPPWISLVTFTKTGI